MKNFKFFALSAALALALTPALVSVANAENKKANHSAKTAAKHDSNKPAKVSFKRPHDGAVLHSPISVEMQVAGLTVAKAGEVKPGEGHHHLLIDSGPIKEGEVIPKNETHIHFGDGSTTAKVPLSPGKHTLTLQFADGAHRSYGPALSSTIHVTVK